MKLLLRYFISVENAINYQFNRVPAVMENLEKSWNLIYKFQAWKSLGI